MKAKEKICHRCQKLKILWRSNPPTCKECDQIIKASGEPVQTSKKPIKKVSDKQSKLNYAYEVLRKQFLKNHQLCEASVVSNCLRKSSEIHHKRGRGVYYLDSSTWLATCSHCHHWIEEHKEEAAAKGLSENRLDKYEL